ncbi:MAG: 50S ribosomal protein L10 [bacterium]
MDRAEKERQVQEIEEKVRMAKITIFSDFCGLKVQEMEQLRKLFREVNAEYKVYKNTLIHRAFGKHDVAGFLKEPTALAFSYKELSAPAKVLVNFAKDKPALKIKGGLVEGQIMGSAAISSLADLPSREILLAHLAQAIQSPLRGFMNVINGPLVKFVMVLRAIEEKKK